MFTDLHTHLLPGVDDGPKYSAQALALAQAALAELGYRPQEITAALRSFDPEGMKTEEIVRQCLRAMVMR